MAFVKMKNMKDKTFVQLMEELYPDVEQYRQEKNKDHNKINNIARYIPSL